MRKIYIALLVIFLCCGELQAALDVRTIWELNASATAGNVNGGGFDPYASVANMIADLACTSATTSAPVCTSATYTFVAGDQTHWLYISSGGTYTTTQFCQIASVSGGAATLTAGAGTCNIIARPFWTTNSSAGVASTGSPTGGVFTIDRSRSTAAVQTSTTATNTAGVITVGSLTYNKSWIGNVLQITAGTGVTQGWYEITNSNGSTNFTLDRDPSGTTNVSMSLGGAISLGSSTANRTDDSFFELLSGTNGTGASIAFAKTGTYTAGGNISVTADGGTQAPVVVEGYNTIRGEALSETNYFILAMGSNTLALGDNNNWYYYKVTSTAATAQALGTGSLMSNCIVVNTSTTTTRIGIGLAANDTVNNCDVVSYWGTAVNAGSVTFTLTNSVIHDSPICMAVSATNSVVLVRGNIFHSCVTNAITFTGAEVARVNILGNTLYGAANKLGVGLNIVTGGTTFSLVNNILTGFVSGVVHADTTQFIGLDDWNDYYNNTTDVTGWQKGPNDITTNPTFSNVTQLTGTTATYAGTTLTDSGADFTNVTNGTYILVKSGTGLTTVNSIAKISSHTTTTIVTDYDIGESSASNWTYQLLTGLNFAPTVSLPGTQGTFPGGFTTGYTGMGAVQRQTGGGGGGIIGGGSQ